MINPVILDRIKQDLILYVQPIFDAKTLEIASYEILSRLPVSNTLLSPPQFMHSVPLSDHYVLAIAVMERLPSILKMIDPNMKVHVNFNPDDFNNMTVYHKVLESKERLIVEITEESGQIDTKIDILQALKKENVVLALDDFGDKNSTYNYFMDQKGDYGLFDMIKIDGSMIHDIDTNAKKLSFTRSVITAMLKHSDQKIAVEYVENSQIKDLAISLGVHYLQGFHLSKPFDARSLLVPFKETRVAVNQ